MTDRIAVIGSSGFVGQALVERLREQGVEAVALSRSNSPDLRDRDADWAGLLLGCRAVVNCAGMAHDLRSLSLDDARTYALVNGLAPQRLARAAIEARVERFVQVSTVKVLGDGTHGKPFSEDDPPNPNGVYALSKALGERLVREATAQTRTAAVVVRLPLVIGRPYKGNLALLEKAISAGVPLPFGHRSVAARSYAQMSDVTDVLSRLATASGSLPEVVHVRTEPDMTAGELAILIGRETGRNPRLVSVPAPVLTRLATVLGRREAGTKMTDEMLMSDEASRRALAL